MPKINNGVLDQYGAEPFEQQQLWTAGTEGVNYYNINSHIFKQHTNSSHCAHFGDFQETVQNC